MRGEHPHLIYDSIPYDEVSALFPVSSLHAEAVVRHANAEELLEATPDAAIIAVAPVSMATGYALAQEPLAVIKLSELSEMESLPVSTDKYELLVRGRPRTGHNHSLNEYA